MVKRIVLGTLLIGLIGVLVAGAVIRTVDKTENVAEARGSGQRDIDAASQETHGQGHGQCDDDTAGQETHGKGHDECDDDTAGQETHGQSNSGGRGRGGDQAERQYPNYQESPAEWVMLEGTVMQTPQDGGDLIIQTQDGEEIHVGTGPGYMEAQGFTLQAGESVQVQGYWEDNELKAALVVRLRDGQTITLRDQSGRPAWAGGGKGAAEQQATTPLGGSGVSSRGQGQGGQGQGSASSSNLEGSTFDTQPGVGLAQVDGWLTIEGTVASVDQNALVLQNIGGEEIIVEGRPWSFAQEQGFVALVGDQVTLVGFYEDESPSASSGHHFEVGQIIDTTNGQSVLIRAENGRPLWAGRGRRGG